MNEVCQATFQDGSKMTLDHANEIHARLKDCSSSDPEAPQQILADARKYLQTLIRICYLRHGFHATDVFIAQPLALIGFMCLTTINQQMPVQELEATRSTLFLVAKGLRDQGRHYYLGQTLFRVIQGQMRPEESALLGGMVNIAAEMARPRQTGMKAVHSQWPASIVSSSVDVESQRSTKLVEQYTNLNMGKEQGDSRMSQLILIIVSNEEGSHLVSLRLEDSGQV
ncbi:MAG: hypothetical protein Q9165_005403 [Trypethelium subeluteriae]